MEYFRDFNVGDKVRVVSEPYLDCPFTWVSAMNDYLDNVVTIRSKSYSEGCGTYAYTIEEDDTRFNWCGNCFVEDDTEVEEISEEDFLKILG